MIVAREPPDPVTDPRVEDLIMEMNVGVHKANKQATAGYETGGTFNYYNEKIVDVTVMDDNDNDSDEDEDEDDSNNNDISDNDVNDNVDEEINVTKKKRMTKKAIQEEKKNIKETTKLIFQIAMEAWENGEFPSIRACALHYNLHPNTLRNKIKTGEEYVGKGRRNEV